MIIGSAGAIFFGLFGKNVEQTGCYADKRIRKGIFIYGESKMRKHPLIVLSVCVIFLMLVGVVSAADEAKRAAKPAVAPGTGLTRDARRDRADTRGRDRIRLKKIDQGIEEKQKQQEKFIGELVAIKELALKENAPKTAKKLGALIKEQKAQLAEALENAKKSRERIREQFTEKHVPTGAPKAAAKEDIDEPKKKRKWWKFWKRP